MPWQHRARAVLEGWLLGQAGGRAVADLLLGDAEPRGRLAETIPLRNLDTPAVGAFPGEHQEVAYREGLLIGYRWYDPAGWRSPSRSGTGCRTRPSPGATCRRRWSGPPTSRSR
jgi:hypothetical protein